ncbi:hypothetical protein [Flavobacterium sp.]|uniref:hypothetical protein n=1 Tax=Flavobacterium sp. TaxID=239 RepID=UPI0037BE2665
MKKKIYIIGNLSKHITPEIQDSFLLTKLELLRIGFDVINPIENLNEKSTINYRIKIRNIKQLAECDAVYLMPCAILDRSKNLELSIALDLNLLVINGTLNLR